MAPETRFSSGRKRPRTVEAQHNLALRHRRKPYDIQGLNGEDDFVENKLFGSQVPRGTIREVEMCDGSLTTTTTTNSRVAGNMFDVKTNSNRLFVNGIDIFSDASQIEYEVYTRPGSYEAGQFGIDGWVPVERGFVAVHGGVAPIRWANPVEIREMSVHAFYVTLTTQNLRYHDHSSLLTGAAAAGNENLDIHVGVGLSYPLGSISVRGVLLSGTLYYKAEGVCATDTESSTGSSSVMEVATVSQPIASFSSVLPVPSLKSTMDATLRLRSEDSFGSSTSKIPSSPHTETSSAISESVESLTHSSTVGQSSHSTSYSSNVFTPSAWTINRLSESLMQTTTSSSIALSTRSKSLIVPSEFPTRSSEPRRVHSSKPSPTLIQQARQVSEVIEPFSASGDPPSESVHTQMPTRTSSPLDTNSDGATALGRTTMTAPPSTSLSGPSPSQSSQPSLVSGLSSRPSFGRPTPTTGDPTSVLSAPASPYPTTPPRRPLRVSNPPNQSSARPSEKQEFPSSAPSIAPSPGTFRDRPISPSISLRQTPDPTPEPVIERVRPTSKVTITPSVDQIPPLTRRTGMPSLPRTEGPTLNPAVCVIIPELCVPTAAPSTASETESPSFTGTVDTSQPSVPSKSPEKNQFNPTVCILIPALCAPTISPSLALPTPAPTVRNLQVPTRDPGSTPSSGSPPSSTPMLTKTTSPTRDPLMPSLPPGESAISPSVCILIPSLCAPTISPSPTFDRTKAPSSRPPPASSAPRPSTPIAESTRAPAFGSVLPPVSPADSVSNPTLCILIPDLCGSSIAAPTSRPSLRRTMEPTSGLGLPSPPLSVRTQVPTLGTRRPSLSPADIPINPTVCTLMPALCAPFAPPNAAPAPTGSNSSLDPTLNTSSSPLESTPNPAACILIPKLCAPTATPSVPLSSTLAPVRGDITLEPTNTDTLEPSKVLPSRPSRPPRPATLGSPAGSGTKPATSQTDMPMPILDPTATPSGSFWPSETPSLDSSETPIRTAPSRSSWPSGTPSSGQSATTTPSGSSWPSGTPSAGQSATTTPSGSSWPSGTPSAGQSATTTPSGSSWPSGTPSSGQSVTTDSLTPSGSSVPSGIPSSGPSITTVPMTPSGSSWPSGTPSSGPSRTAVGMTPSGSSSPSGTPSSVPSETPSGSSRPSEIPSSGPSETPSGSSPILPSPSPRAIPISCPGFVQGQDGTADVEVDFSYRVETSSAESTFLSDLEEAILLEVSKLVLTCQGLTDSDRRLQANDETRIYQVGYRESGTISETTPCLPTEPSALYCFDVDSHVVVIGNDGNEQALQTKVLSTIGDVFIDGEAIEKDVPGVTVYQIVDPAPTISSEPASSSQESGTLSDTGPLLLIISLSVVAIIVALIVAYLVYRWHRKRSKRRMSSTPPRFENDDEHSANLLDRYNSQNNDPGDGHSRYDYEAATEPFSQQRDENVRLLGSEPDEQSDYGMENAAIYEDNDKMIAPDFGNSFADGVNTAHNDDFLDEMLHDEEIH